MSVIAKNQYVGYKAKQMPMKLHFPNFLSGPFLPPLDVLRATFFVKIMNDVFHVLPTYSKHHIMMACNFIWVCHVRLCTLSPTSRAVDILITKYYYKLRQPLSQIIKNWYQKLEKDIQSKVNSSNWGIPGASGLTKN